MIRIHDSKSTMLPMSQRSGSGKRRLTRALLVLGCATLIILYAIQALDVFYSIKASNRFVALVTPATTPPNTRVLILQHIAARSNLDTASHDGHKAYATAWGYEYRADRGNYVKGKVHGSFNKIHVLQKAMMAEMANPQGAEWILYCDADTVITDPSVGLHHLLPPSSLRPTPLFIAGQDHNGFNAGVFAIRVSAKSADFVAELIEASKDGHSDQHHLGRALRTLPYGEHFYELPRRWFNAYFLDDGGHAIDAGGNGWDPLLQVHLVNHLKFKYSIQPMVQHAATVAQQAADARNRVKSYTGSMFELLPQNDWTIQRAKSWWAGARGGVTRMRFLDEVDGLVDGPAVEP